MGQNCIFFRPSREWFKRNKKRNFGLGPLITSGERSKGATFDYSKKATKIRSFTKIIFYVIVIKRERY